MWSNLGVKLNISTTSEEFIQAYDVLPPREKLGMDKIFNLTDLSKYEEGGCQVPPRTIYGHQVLRKVFFNCCSTVHIDKYKLFPPTNALFIKT
jgi:hypothetical protein